MAIGIFLLAFCMVLGGLALRFAVPRAKTTKQLRSLAALFAVLTLFLLLDAVISWAGRRSLVAALEAVPLQTRESVAEATAGQEVLVAGSLLLEAEEGDGGAEARFRCDPECSYTGPLPLPVAVEGGARVGIANVDYETRDWPIVRHGDRDYSTALEQGAAVVALGVITRSAADVTAPLANAGASGNDPQAAREAAPVTAEMTAVLVYAGNYDDFADRAERRVLIPTALLVLSALGALLGIGLAASLLLRRGEAEAEASTDGPLA